MCDLFSAFPQVSFEAQLTHNKSCKYAMHSSMDGHSRTGPPRPEGRHSPDPAHLRFVWPILEIHTDESHIITRVPGRYVFGWNHSVTLSILGRSSATSWEASSRVPASPCLSHGGMWQQPVEPGPLGDLPVYMLLAAVMATGLPGACAPPVLRGTAKSRAVGFSRLQQGKAWPGVWKRRAGHELEMSSMTLRRSFQLLGPQFPPSRNEGSSGLDALCGPFGSTACDPESALLRFIEASSVRMWFPGDKSQLGLCVHPSLKLSIPADLIYFTPWD